MTPEELRTRRQALGLTQAQLAAALGVARNTVTRWELGTMAMCHAQLVDAALAQLEREILHGDLQRSFLTPAALECYCRAYLGARAAGSSERQAVAMADQALARLGPVT